MSRIGRAARFAMAYGFGAASAVYTFTVGLMSSRHRGLIIEIGRHFGYRHNYVASMLPPVAPDSLVAGNLEVVVPAILGVDGNVTAMELIVLDRLVRAFAPRALFEIGTFDGRTTLNLAANAPRDARVVTLDLPEGPAPVTAARIDPSDRAYIERRSVGARYRGQAGSEKIEQRFGDSATFDFGPYRGAIDFVFIDGAHSYAYVLSDSDRALALLRGGRGVIVWHDYAGVWPGVTRALNELYAQGGVFRGLRHVEGTTLAVLVDDARP